MRSRISKSSSARSESATWQLQTAKAKFSELFRTVFSDGPQVVTRQGKDTIVVLTSDSFKALQRRAGRQQSLVRFFADSPLAGLSIQQTENLKRDNS
jgi:prevent-host-death family protein